MVLQSISSNLPPTPGRQVKYLKSELEKNDAENEALNNKIADLSKALESIQLVKDSATTAAPEDDKKKGKKDKNAPKPAVTAYKYFSEEVKAAPGGDVTSGKEMQQMWKDCQGDARKKYLDMAAEDKSMASESSRVIYLKCPFDEKDEAKSLGARFDGNNKKWFVPLDRFDVIETFNKWRPDGKVYLRCPFEEKDEAKVVGARWDRDVKKWYIPDIPSDKKVPGKFKKWLPPDNAQSKKTARVEKGSKEDASLPYGSKKAGSKFDDGNNPGIVSLFVQAGSLIDAVGITYEGGKVAHHGGTGGGKTEYTLVDGEIIDRITVRHGPKGVYSLTFQTNKGNAMGPCGGKGGLFHKTSEEVVQAPDGKKLVGLKGRSSKFLDAIGFRWGPA